MATGVRARAERPALITSARFSKTLDADARTRRYLISMAVRVACFLGGCFTPFPWSWVLFAGAAVIPPVAVLLANAIDQRTVPGPAPLAAEGERAALPPATVIPGSVEE